MSPPRYCAIALMLMSSQALPAPDIAKRPTTIEIPGTGIKSTLPEGFTQARVGVFLTDKMGTPAIVLSASPATHYERRKIPIIQGIPTRARPNSSPTSRSQSDSINVRASAIWVTGTRHG
jgi:hypothetical protein